MTLDALKRLASLGEGQHLEFKHRVPRPEKIAREVIALANTGGGKLLLGVEDDGTVLGVRDVQEEAFALADALRSCCDPPVEGIRVASVPVSRRREALVVDVPNSPDKPHFLVEEQEGRQPRRTAFVRARDESIVASREAVRLMRADTSDAGVRFEFGDKERRLMEYLDRFERVTVAEFARMADVPKRSASHTLVLLTRAGVLAHHADAREDHFTLAYGTAA